MARHSITTSSTSETVDRLRIQRTLEREIGARAFCGLVIETVVNPVGEIRKRCNVAQAIRDADTEIEKLGPVA